MLAGSCELHLGVDIRAMFEKEVCDFEVSVQYCPRERGVEHTLNRRCAPVKLAPHARSVAREMVGWIAQRGLAGVVERASASEWIDHALF